jgi:hypothetical protein
VPDRIGSGSAGLHAGSQPAGASHWRAVIDFGFDLPFEAHREFLEKGVGKASLGRDDATAGNRLGGLRSPLR